MTCDASSIIQTLEKELINKKSSLIVPKDFIDELFKYSTSHSLVYWKDKSAIETYLGLGVYKKIDSIDEYKNNNDILDYHSFGAQYFEAKEHSSDLWEDFTPFHFIIPEYLFIQNKETNEITLQKYTNDLKSINTYFSFSAKKKHPTNELIKTSESPNKENWTEEISKLKSLFDESFNKVVLSKMTTIELKYHVKSREIFLKNKNLMHNCHHFYISPSPNISFISLTPETLYKKEEGHITVDAIAGTRARGINKKEDDLLGTDLINSHKDQKEHEIVISMVKEAVQGFGTVVQGKTKLLKLKNVQHLFTPLNINADLNKSFLEFVELLHPTPAVGGFPKEQAQTYIRKNESYERGLYAAPIGHISKDKEELAVGIRSALIKGKTAYIFGGCGIIKDSDSEAEWNEINQKTKYLIDSFYE